MDDATASASERSQSDPARGSNEPPGSRAPHAPSPGGDWRRDAEELGQRARVFVSENPLAALGIALAAGFVVGRIVRAVK